MFTSGPNPLNLLLKKHVKFDDAANPLNDFLKRLAKFIEKFYPSQTSNNSFLYSYMDSHDLDGFKVALIYDLLPRTDCLTSVNGLPLVNI